MIYVFDTSTLFWAYVDGPISRRCRYIISRCVGRVFVAEITMLEIVSALGKAVREGKISVKQFDRANAMFLQNIAAGKLEVMQFPSSEFIGCRDLLTIVGMKWRRGLRTQDAIVAYTARRLAFERGQAVTLLTSDRKLAKIVNDLALFEKRVNCEYLDPT